MEKLIELVYKYNEEKEWKRLWLITSVKENDEEIWFDKKKEVMKYECEIISKSYGFIKWLVENNKIETNNLSLKAFKNIFSGGWFVEVSDLEVLLMLLAISDTPIDDLISYLK